MLTHTISCSTQIGIYLNGRFSEWKSSTTPSTWHFYQQKVINPHDYSYLHDCAHICKGAGPVDLLVMVASAVSHFSRRSAIRETWGSSQGTSKLRSKVIFLLGKAKDRREQAQVDTESQSHADVLQEDFVVSSPTQLRIKMNWESDEVIHRRTLTTTWPWRQWWD